MTRRGRLARLLVGLLALAAVAAAAWRLHAATAPLGVETAHAGGIPLTVFRPAAGTPPGPVVVIAHGFAGAQQLMLPFAATLARHGHLVVTFDFPGHGRNPEPLPGGIRDDRRAGGALLAALASVEERARTLPGGDERVVLLGHSMGGDILLRRAVAAAAEPGSAVAGTIAVSTFGAAVQPGGPVPRNLLAIVGALEPGRLAAEARRMLAEDGLEEGATPERFAAGTARRLVLSPGVEHIGVLYGAEGLAAAARWVDGIAGRDVGAVGFVDARGPWIGLLMLGLVALAWPLATLLPRADRAAGPGLGAGLGWRRLWPVALLPAVATPLILRPLPTEALPLLLGDYVAVHCALYGALTAFGLWWAGAPSPFGAAARRRTAWGAVALGGAALAAYGILGIGSLLDAEVMAFRPVGDRWWLVAAMLAGLLPFFLADEWLARGPGAPRLAYAATKLCFLLSLALAIALDLRRLFFLIIILPVILLLFIAFARFGAWAWRRTGHPWVAALGNAAILAWAIAVIFPLVAR